MTIRKFEAIIHVESPTKARTLLIANIDPNLPLLPQSLLEFIMKKLCGVLLAKLQQAAKKVGKDPVLNPHACKMRQEEDFYKMWLMAKFEGICKVRGWTMPPVKVFALTDQELERAAVAQEKLDKTKRLYHSMSDDRLSKQLKTENSNLSEPPYVGSPMDQCSEDSDSISDLSLNSGSALLTAWKNNPLASYLRDLEEKTQLRKAEEIAKARERAANRLKPRALDPVAQSRLDELRAAKERRRLQDERKEGKPVIPPEATKSQRKLIKAQHKQDWATMWSSHGMITRLIVVQSLMGFLFGVLYTDSLAGITPQKIFFDSGGTWSQRLYRDSGFIVYLAVCAGVHFTLCYVALMYAFSGIQLGKMAGAQAKKFYSENIHLIVAASSAGMVFMGIVKALLMSIIRLVVFYYVWVARELKGAMNPFTNGLALLVPDVLEPVVVTMMSAFESFQTLMIRIGTTIFSGVERVFLESNALGELVSRTYFSFYEYFSSVLGQWDDFIKGVVDSYEGRIDAMSWREEAYDATRMLLSYSSFFLLVLLVLFQLYARNVRDAYKGESSVEERLATMQHSESSSLSSVRSNRSAPARFNTNTTSEPASLSVNASVPRSAGYATPRSQLSPIFDTIEEEITLEGEGSKARIGGTEMPMAAPSNPQSPSSPTADGRKKKRGFRFRLKKRKDSGTETTKSGEPSRGVGRNYTM